jgi:glycosyltransferase involved in cell wall biosynthesis
VSRFKARARGFLRSRPVGYVPNGVDAYWDRALTRRFDFAASGLEPGSYLLFACGRLDATKGLHWLLEAFGGSNVRASLLVVGDASHDVAYAERIRDVMAKDPRVVFLPELLDRDRLIDVVRQARLFVFPSEVEAMSMMLLEAVSCKRLVVCSDIPENRAIVGDDYPFLFRSRDAAHLTGVLAAAWEAASHATVHPLAEALYERTATEFRWTTIARTYHDIYRACVTANEDETLPTAA